MISFKEDGTPSPDGRAQPRASLFLAAVMRAGQEQAPVKVRNLSPNGAMIESPVIPCPGTAVDLVRGALIARGTVMWSSAKRFGLQFSSEVSPKDWTAAPSKLQQQRVDDVVALVKAGATEFGTVNEIPEARSQDQLVDDLSAVIDLLNDLENDLAASDETLAKHALKLQNLDIAMQIVRAVAAELTFGSGISEIGLARLKDLRVSCAQALGTSAR